MTLQIVLDDSLSPLLRDAAEVAQRTAEFVGEGFEHANRTDARVSCPWQGNAARATAEKGGVETLSCRLKLFQLRLRAECAITGERKNAFMARVSSCASSSLVRSCSRAIRRLMQDQSGFIISTELILVATVLVIGLIAGLVTVRDQVVTELGDFAAAISDLDQSYSFGNVVSPSGSTNGSNFVDLVAFCDTAGSQESNTNNACILIANSLVEEG